MAPLSGSAKKKKQKEKEREIQRLKVIEERQAGSDTSPDDDIPATQAYGPWDEPKEKWDARLEAQPQADASWDAFEKRAKARKGKAIEYQPAAIPDEQTMHVDASTKFDSTAKPVQKIVFASGINVDDTIVDVIANADATFRSAVRVFIAGDAERKEAIEITSAGVEKLTKALPQLEIIALHGTSKLTRTAFPTILKNCANIESVTLTVVQGQKSKRIRLNSTMDWLTDKTFVPKLRYLEFRGVYHEAFRREFLEFLTKCRPALEIVFEYDRPAVLIRDMETVPLDRVPAADK
ncbi:hypothetical protein J4E91_009362 [Alternaria rosae]|nr:hypothetical protein J4E91_009362 [Alternaria rosae]